MRHPATIPIEVTSDPDHPLDTSRLQDVSHGGLCYRAGERRRPGEAVCIRIPLITEDFMTPGRVVWCRPDGDGFLIGVEFLHADDAYRARMIEQLCHIEAYRRNLLEDEGRELSSEQAAIEWIERYAQDFPNPPRANTG